MVGFFITFEGGEGVGKSTQIALLAERLIASGRVVRSLRLPGGTDIGGEIRHLVKHHPGDLSPEAELLLFGADMAQLVREVIRPARARGEIVLCDRFYDSTIAYQAYGRGLSMESVQQLIQLAVGETKPDITFFIDAPPAVGLATLSRRVSTLHDRFDAEERTFHERVYLGYQEQALKEPGRIVSVTYRANDAQGMHEDIYQTLAERLKR